MNKRVLELLSIVDDINSIDDQIWYEGLTARKKAELEFHDRDRDPDFVEGSQANDTYEKFYGNKKYYNITQRSQNYVQSWISENAKGKVFLDYACGNGGNAILAAKSGASLALGLDISSVSVKNAQLAADNSNLEKCKFFQADAENTKLPDNSIDTIICSGMLHHLDLSYAFPELRRILKPGGKLLAVEALDYNPLIKIYRILTPEMRTEWEKAHILNLNDLKFAERFFSLGQIKYWHVLGYIAGKFPILRKPTDLLDRFLEATPLLNRMAWMFTFELIKKEDK